jgi:hypothetical protein
VINGVGIVGGLSSAHEDPRAPVMVRGGYIPVGPDAVLVPRLVRLRRDMDHTELAYRVQGMDREIEGIAVHTGMRGLSGVRGPVAHAVKG